MNSEITQAKIYLNQPSPQLQESILQSLHQYLNPSHHPNYIWHHAQPPSIQSTHSDPSLIQIKLRYGQSIQDEWFLVSCLFQISLSYDVLIQITDDDGEFLLIEAAQHLPKWITPHLANGRVKNLHHPSHHLRLHLILTSSHLPSFRFGSNLDPYTLSLSIIHLHSIFNLQTYLSPLLFKSFDHHHPLPWNLLSSISPSKSASKLRNHLSCSSLISTTLRLTYILILQGYYARTLISSV